MRRGACRRLCRHRQAVGIYVRQHALEFAALTKEAGIPDGIFNVVTGFGPEIGTEFISHPGVAKITFTGSDTTGAKVYETAARSLKRVSLELGGKSPNIVFEDADLAAAAAGAVSGIFAATGQTCIAGSRLLVQKSIRAEFEARLLELARSAKIGDPMKSDTNIGPITTPAQYKKVLDYIEIAKSEGARCLLGGKPASGAGIVGGQFVEPTIFTDVDNTMRIAREEVLARCSRSSASTPRKTPFVSPTTPSMVSRRVSGPAISRAPCACRNCCAPERSG